MATYSFLDVYCSISGPGGNFPLTGCASQEGISVSFDDDKTATLTGADGCIMHSLRGTRTGTIAINLLKISQVNQKLSQMYNYQRVSSALWGYNVITLNDLARGDSYLMTIGAFVKVPDNAYAQDGNILNWHFRGMIDFVLGSGLTELSAENSVLLGR